MFHADFPLQFQAGLHARPLGHLTHLGLTIDGKPLRADNADMAEYEAPHSTPDRVVRLAADSGDPTTDRALVQYGKATIQAGDGPYRSVMHPFGIHPKTNQLLPADQLSKAVQGAVGQLQADPDWAPYVQVGEGGAAERAAKVAAPLQWDDRVVRRGPTEEFPAGDNSVCPNCMRARLQHGLCPGCGYEEPPSGADPDTQYGGHDNPQQPDYGDWQTKDASWHEIAMPLQDFQTQRGDFGSQQGLTGEALCPKCGTLNQPGATQCMKCGAKIGLTQPSHSGGPSNAYSNPYTGNPPVTSSVMSEMSKWHLADIGVGAPVQQQPDTVDGPFNDHRDVSEMSYEQAVGHERLVNIVVDEMNKALTQGGAVDATLVNNLVQWLVDKFGQDADSAQAIVDAASKQAETSDGRLDNTPVVPDPAEQAIQPTQGDVVTDPSQEQNSGAFQSHVRTPSGRVGHVIDRWEDMYGEKWAMVGCYDGHRESAYEDDLTEVEAPEPENAVEELQSFMESLEPVEANVASIKARIANMRIVKQEIRRHMANERLTMDERLALDQMDADASVDMLALTDAVVANDAKESAYLAGQPKFVPSMSEDVQATLYGVEHLAIGEAPDPEWTTQALEAFLPEEAEVLVSELDPAVRADTDALVGAAVAHVDGMTAGHLAEVRAHHRSRFVAAVTSLAADYTTVDEPDTTDDGRDWDGPAEGIFN